MQHPETTPAFIALSNPTANLDEETFALLEKFTSHLYDSQTEVNSLAKVRRELFATKNKFVQFIPPTVTVLRQHSLRAAYQAGHIWGTAIICENYDPPSPSSWG